MTDQKFYKTTYKIVVLSQEPLPPDMSLKDIDYAITFGECSGEVGLVQEEIMNGEQAAKALIAQGSDPGFFGLDDEGNDSDEL